MTLTLAVAGAACNSDDKENLAAADGGGGGGDKDAGTEAGPLYLLHSGVTTADDRANYFTVTDSLDQVRELSYENSLEIPGRARLYAQEGTPFFAIGDSEALTLTRYSISDSGELETGASLSLQPFGVTKLGAQAVFFASETKAYFKDPGEAQIIIWNPQEMAVEGTIELPESLLREGYVAGMSAWAGRDGEAFLTVSWSTPAYDQVLEGTALVRIDTATDAVTVTNDDRCRGITKVGRVGETLYFFSGVINGFGHAVYPDEGGQADCILRITAGETEFDSEYLGSMSNTLPEGVAGTVISVGSDGELWAQVVDLSVAPSTPGSTYGEWYSTGWNWWHMPIDSFADPASLAAEPGAYSSFLLAADPGFYISRSAEDYSETTLLDLSNGTPEEGLSFPGFTLDIVQLR
tara:strand:- start:205 stop:1425 length:1221 start_codon:yes stop_codon:yes gene_type:complete